MSFARNTVLGMALIGSAVFVGHKEGYLDSSYINPAEDSTFRFGEMPCEQKAPLVTGKQTREVLTALLKQCGTITWCVEEYPLSLDNGATLFTVCADTDTPIIHMPDSENTSLSVELDLRAVLAKGQTIPQNTWYAVDANLQLDKGTLYGALSQEQNKQVCIDTYVNPLDKQITDDLNTLLQGSPIVTVLAQHGANLCGENSNYQENNRIK